LIDAIASLLLSAVPRGLRRYSDFATPEPPADLALVEKTAALDLVGRELAARGEAVDLLGLAAKDGSELVNGEESR
jgi:hypothetical protein